MSMRRRRPISTPPMDRLADEVVHVPGDPRVARCRHVDPRRSARALGPRSRGHHLSDADAAPITLRQMLDHTSGLPREYDRSKTATEAEVLVQLQGLSLEYPPGQTFSYSNLGFVLLGMTVATRRTSRFESSSPSASSSRSAWRRRRSIRRPSSHPRTGTTTGPATSCPSTGSRSAPAASCRRCAT